VGASVCSIGAHPSKFHNKYVRVRGTAISAISVFGGVKVSTLIGFKDGKFRQVCGQINLDLDSAGSDESTTKFLQLFAEQITPPNCNGDERLIQGFRHALDPSIPAPPPCLTFICPSCPRYSIVATFTGKFRYFRGEPGHLYDFQLDVISVSDLDVTDRTAHPKP